MEEQRSRADSDPNPTSVERRGDCELLVTRTFDAPPNLVYRAWSQAELFQRWWVPQSATGVSLVSCEMDVRTGGTYQLEFEVGGPQSMSFHGKYLEVNPDERIVWTNDEGEDDGAVTTVTFERRGGQTMLTFHEVYPSKKALDEAMQGAAAGLPEQLEQLGALLARNGA